MTVRPPMLQSLKLLVFESHPVQYRAPIYRALQLRCPNQFQVVYGTDQSIRGWTDEGFGKAVAWDEPLLEGYPSQILGNSLPEGLSGFSSLSGQGIRGLLRNRRPQAVLLTQFRYAFDWTAFVSARTMGIKTWIRQETQDAAFERSRAKDWVRSMCYRLIYSQVNHAFYIGSLNQSHLTRHGISVSRMTRSPYATVDRCVGISDNEIWSRRNGIRRHLGIKPEEWVVAFSGKFIEKKDPALVLDAVSGLPQKTRNPVSVLMIGSGELEPSLRQQAERLTQEGIRVVFAGFVNQSAICDYYLAADALVLPSRRMGETWGLVVNEALQAGCAVVMSDAVGCAAEFGSWERVRVVPVGSADQCRAALAELAVFPRSFFWCREKMRTYSIETAADALASQMAELA